MATKQITLPVTGMTCAMCVRNVERSLQKAEGVAEVSVNLATEKANVQYDSDKLAASDLIVQVERAGYGVAATTIDLPITGHDLCYVSEKRRARPQQDRRRYQRQRQSRQRKSQRRLPAGRGPPP